VRFADRRDHDVPSLRREGCTVLSQKLAFTLKHGEAYLTLDVMGVHREFLASPKVEIQDLKVRGVVNQEVLEGFLPKTVCLIEIDFIASSTCLQTTVRRVPFPTGIYLTRIAS
jgi:hypothetical protein